jgi:HEPN/RES N-terminal domain 1
VLTGEGLLDAVQEAVDDRVWVEVHFIEPRQEEALIASWERFCDAVQYETRYVFWLRGDEADDHLRGAGDAASWSNRSTDSRARCPLRSPGLMTSMETYCSLSGSSPSSSGSTSRVMGPWYLGVLVHNQLGELVFSCLLTG